MNTEHISNSSFSIPDEVHNYDATIPHLNTDNTNGEEFHPQNEHELVPGVPIPDNFQRYSGPHVTIAELQRDKEIVKESSGIVREWLKSNEAELIGRVHEAPAPVLADRVVPQIPDNVRSLFRPKDRKLRKAEAVEFTTRTLIGSLSPNTAEQSFIKRMLPEGINLAETIILFDKDPRYRDAIVAASYRILEQSAADGTLDSYERVKLNRDYKSVNHNDPSLQRGRNRDVVVGMVLDMLSGRFNAEENWETSIAMGDNERDSRGVFRGGHHSGAAYHVLHTLSRGETYKKHFGEPYYTNKEKFLRSLNEKDFQEELRDPTLKLGTDEEYALNQGIEMRTNNGDVKTLGTNATNLMVVAGDHGNQPISLRQASVFNEQGQEVHGVRVQYIREAGSIDFGVLQNARNYGVASNNSELKEVFAIAKSLKEDQGYEFFVPEGQEITFGRSPDATVQLKQEDSVSRQHCKVKVIDGQFIISDTSKNGTVFMFSGPELSKETAMRQAIESAPVIKRTDEELSQSRPFENRYQIQRYEQRKVPIKKRISQRISRVSDNVYKRKTIK